MTMTYHSKGLEKVHTSLRLSTTQVQCERTFDSLGNTDLANIIRANKIVFDGEITVSGGVLRDVQVPEKLEEQLRTLNGFLELYRSPAHRLSYVSLFLTTAIELARQKYGLPSNFLFAEYCILHPELGGIGPIRGDIDVIVASTVGHVQPTQGLRRQCIPDEIRFFATLPRMGGSGEWRNDLAVILAQLLGVRELNKFRPALSPYLSGARPERHAQAGVITDGFRWEFFTIQKAGDFNIVHSTSINDAHTEEGSKRRVLGPKTSFNWN